MTIYEVFRLEKRSKVFWVVMTNASKRNAMGKAFWRELSLVFQEADKDPDTRAVVLAAEGKSFCAGMDLMTFAGELPMLANGAAGGRPKQEFLDIIRQYQKITSAPEFCRKPVIAAIQGHCIGGGLDLAAACDLRLACQDATFSLREARMAMIADLGSLQRVASIVGEGIARELAFTASDMDAERALSMHLVNAVYPDLESLWSAAQEMGEKIADNSPIAVETTKETMNFGRGRTIEEGLEYSALRQIALLPNPDLMEAITAFAERRKPNFQRG